RKKLKNETAETKEQILRLKQRVDKLRENNLVSDAEIHSKLQRLEQLELESKELRNKNLDLLLENSELARRLESDQLLATSILEDPDEALELRRDMMHLRQENENLTNVIERLKSDRCADVEELVYLRWINACLRYEVRNYQPPPGKTIARDLSKTLSPRSEEKAKRLILDYANTQAGASTKDREYERWSSSQADLTDSPEALITDVSSSSKTDTSSKAKFFGKLRRLILGKHDHDRQQHHHHHRRASTMTKARSVDDFLGNEERSGDVKSPRNWRYFMSSGRSSIELGMLPSLYEEDTRYMNGVHVNNDSNSIRNAELLMIEIF
ncbi:CHUP1, chloroplastic-like protein, partial [Drosera capensis]